MHAVMKCEAGHASKILIFPAILTHKIDHVYESIKFQHFPAMNDY